MKGQLLLGDVIDFAMVFVCVLYEKGGALVGGKILKGKLCPMCQDCSDPWHVLSEIYVCILGCSWVQDHTRRTLWLYRMKGEFPSST